MLLAGALAALLWANLPWGDISGIRCSTVVDGAVNGDVFEAFVEQVLVPRLGAGDVVVMDNLSSHERLLKLSQAWPRLTATRQRMIESIVENIEIAIRRAVNDR